MLEMKKLQFSIFSPKLNFYFVRKLAVMIQKVVSVINDVPSSSSRGSTSQNSGILRLFNVIFECVLDLELSKVLQHKVPKIS